LGVDRANVTADEAQYVQVSEYRELLRFLVQQCLKYTTNVQEKENAIIYAVWIWIWQSDGS
jgi:hypothetical protein